MHETTSQEVEETITGDNMDPNRQPEEDHQYPPTGGKAPEEDKEADLDQEPEMHKAAAATVGALKMQRGEVWPVGVCGAIRL